jgi:hypothetical protein
VARQSADQGQPSTRRPGIVYDQHKIPGHPVFSEGRPWRCEVDNRSGLPLGPFQPLGWRAPWIPPQGAQVFKCHEDNPTRITINYAHILDEDEKAQKETEDSRKAAAAARGWDHTDPEKQDLLDKVSQPRGKTRPPELSVACMQGDLWILGATDRENPKVAKFLPKKLLGTGAILSKYPDLTAPPSEEEAERYMDLEEAFDPDATPKGRVPVKPKARKPKDVAA